MNEEKNIIAELQSELEFITLALAALNHAYNNCKTIGIKDKYTFDELDKWEALTARFSRISDITTQKIMNSILIIEKGFSGSLIDKANFAEQNGWVANAEEFINLRFLRNYIAHEYSRQATNEIFEKVMNSYEFLLSLVNSITTYCHTRLFVKK